MTWLEEVCTDAANRVELRGLEDALLSDEVEIAIQYFKNLIASRPKYNAYQTKRTET